MLDASVQMKIMFIKTAGLDRGFLKFDLWRQFEQSFLVLKIISCPMLSNINFVCLKTDYFVSYLATLKHYRPISLCLLKSQLTCV
jgi:hypothetical protein